MIPDVEPLRYTPRPIEACTGFQACGGKNPAEGGEDVDGAAGLRIGPCIVRDDVLEDGGVVAAAVQEYDRVGVSVAWLRCEFLEHARGFRLPVHCRHVDVLFSET